MKKLLLFTLTFIFVSFAHAQKYYMVDARGWVVEQKKYSCPDCSYYKAEIEVDGNSAQVVYTYWPNGKRTSVFENYKIDYSPNNNVPSNYTKKYKSVSGRTVSARTEYKYLYFTSDMSKIVMQTTGWATINDFGERCREDSPFPSKSSSGSTYGGGSGSYDPSSDNNGNGSSGRTVTPTKEVEKYCRLCGGDGKCKTCNGNGYWWSMNKRQPCPNCYNQNGKCTSCGGSGRR